MAKFRTGFVSNSSSSSFIIAGPKNVDIIKIEIEVDLFQLTEKIITNKEELDCYFIERYGDDEDDTIEDALLESNMKKRYEQALFSIKNGKILYVGWASNEGHGEEAFVGEHGFGKISTEGFEIIEDAGNF